MSKQRIFRWRFVSRIENTIKRRIALVLTLPLIVLVNCWLVTWPVLWRTALLPIALPCWWWQNNRTAIESFAKRWRVPLRDGEEA